MPSIKRKRDSSQEAPLKLSRDSEPEEEYKDICSICLDGLDVVDEYGIFSVVPGCRHNFHMSCLYGVCTTDGLPNLCPLCRGPIPCDKIKSMKEYVPLLSRIRRFIGGPRSWMPAPVLVQGNEPTHWRTPPGYLRYDRPYSQVFNALASEADDLKIPFKCENYTHNDILELKRSIEILYFSVLNDRRLKNQDGLFPSWVLLNPIDNSNIEPNIQEVKNAIVRLKETLETIIENNNRQRGLFNLFERRTKLCMDTFFKGLTKIYIREHPRTDQLVGTLAECSHGFEQPTGGSKKRNKKNKKTKKKKKYKTKKKINRTKRNKSKKII